MAFEASFLEFLAMLKSVLCGDNVVKDVVATVITSGARLLWARESEEVLILPGVANPRVRVPPDGAREPEA